jgi:lipopolysaccharide transport system permease protein
MAPMRPGRPTATPSMVISPRRGWFHLDLGELWRYRELGYFLVWRDVKVRYKQTAIGAAWAVLTPIVLMVVFTFVFGKGRSGAPPGISAPIWYFAGLLPWTYFAQALQSSSGSVLGQQSVITKIYFPRLMLPLAGVLPALVDFVFSFAVLVVLMFAYGVPVTARMAVIPLLLVICTLTAFGAGTWLSATNALYRDVREGVPFIIQILLFTSPILLPRARIPVWFRPVYGLNPMATVIEGCRWAVTGAIAFPWDYFLPGMCFLAVLLFGGLVFFRRIEEVIIDVV